ncbi:murein biosynthesis integral membrane protein MurJ [Clostridium perfringens]
MKKNAMFMTAILMVSNIIVKVLGLFRDVALANTYGTSIYSDVYIISSNIPIVLFSVVAVAISTCFIPIYSEVCENEGKSNAIKFMNNFINILLVISLIITIFGEIFPGGLVKIFAYGFDKEAYNLTVNLTKILMPNVIIIALMSVMGSYLQLNKDFIPISYVSIPNNIIVIISIFLAYYKKNIYILAIGTFIGMMSQLIYYYPFMKKHKYKHSLYINIKDKYIRNICIMIVPVFISAAVNQINTIVDRTLVSGLEQGSIAALNYATKLIGFITGVFIVSIITIIYPKMSKMAAKRKLNELKNYSIEVLMNISVILIPITLITIVYSKDIVRIIFQRGSFNEQSTYMTSIALAAYAIGLVGIGFREVLTKAYFSLKDTKTPMINGIVAVLFNIILDIILIKKIGFVGSALATSIASILTSILLLTRMKKHFESFINFKIILNFFKIIIVAILSIGLSNYLYRNLLIFINSEFFKIVLLAIILVVNFIIYLIGLLILKEMSIFSFFEDIKEKIKNRKG